MLLGKHGIPDSRFSEWSQAVWEAQRAYLFQEEGSTKWDFHFLGIYHDSEGHLLDSHKALITGRAMSQWWDKSDESGPTSRQVEAFAVETPALECLTITDGSLKRLCLQSKKNPNCVVFDG